MAEVSTSKAYLGLVRTGYVSSQKRDVLLEASSDIEYIEGTPSRFWDASVEAAKDPITCAVSLIGELIEMGFCSLATWGYGSQTKVIYRTREELHILLAECQQGQHIFEFFLKATPLGHEWVRRYLELVGELDAKPHDARVAGAPLPTESEHDAKDS